MTICAFTEDQVMAHCGKVVQMIDVNLLPKSTKAILFVRCYGEISLIGATYYHYMELERILMGITCSEGDLLLPTYGFPHGSLIKEPGEVGYIVDIIISTVMFIHAIPYKILGRTVNVNVDDKGQQYTFFNDLITNKFGQNYWNEDLDQRFFICRHWNTIQTNRRRSYS